MTNVPDDFPRDPFPASLAGAQPKLAGRLIDGKFVVGLTEEERAGRYKACQDLVDQLVAYCHRKAIECPARSSDDLLDWVARGARNKQVAWRLGGPEIEWVIEQVRNTYNAMRGGSTMQSVKDPSRGHS